MTTLLHSARPTRSLNDHPVLCHLPASALADGANTVWVLLDETGLPIRGGLNATFHGTEQALTAERWVDASGLRLALPFTDIHCHGGGGFSYEDPGCLPRALEVHGEHGTGRAVASLVANPIPDLEASCRRLAEAIDARDVVPDGMRLEGIHAEGPWISPSHKGAHRPDYLHPASVEEARRLVDACGGHLRQVTLAPEEDPGLAVTRYLVDRGVRVAVGHTDADYHTARAAFDAGASVLTHAFNAMNGIHHRRPGPVVAAMESSHVYLEVIADGVHVAPEVVSMLFRSAPERVILVTDAMSATGQPDGDYRLGSLDVRVEAGVARLVTADGSQGAIAGSTLTLDQAVRTAVAAGIDPDEAIIAATSRPARALGLNPCDEALPLRLLDADFSPVADLSPRTSSRRPRP
ncbi:N-acetylglucosamine-6-phosphate deacetylase [Kocuria massiliensis]|uniref:N-acetylglucosamine-6-phosphate deacetylase n=1 Tax=Kocuria massiliensis TaxID=1926282 RepID=UPI0022B98C31|nr:amidohydrolase family protein [Kocuria massiliensis]